MEASWMKAKKLAAVTAVIDAAEWFGGAGKVVR